MPPYFSKQVLISESIFIFTEHTSFLIYQMIETSNDWAGQDHVYTLLKKAELDHLSVLNPSPVLAILSYTLY